MKKKSLLLTAVATLGLTAATMAQNVPNYVPTNGLVGWWPFNGNANDESGNGNNGTVNGATLTADRFGNSNKAYSFDGANDLIIVSAQSTIAAQSDYSVSFWFNSPSSTFNGTFISLNTWFCKLGHDNPGLFYKDEIGNQANNWYVQTHFLTEPVINTWNNLVIKKTSTNVDLFLNTSYVGSITTYGFSNFNPSSLIQFGYYCCQNYYNGQLDDVGIWNRALTQQEISNLYNASNCASNTIITPQTNSLSTGSTAIFTATTSDPNPSFVWQSDFGQGYVNLNNYGNYSGTTTGTLNVANVQLSEHNQPIRVITTSGNCIDTSNVAVINILDTCLVTVYDTLLTTVTDTLVINATITGINPPNNLNTLKVFPNPASTHITIDYGNFASMSGYTLKITNNLGQVVFTSPINQQSSYIDLSTWTGNGIYFIQIIDTQNNTIENRKIVIQ